MRSKFDVNKNFDAALWRPIAAGANIRAMSEKVIPRFKQRRRIFIREWRKHRGLTLEQLSERAGMTPGNLSHLERGLIPYNQDTLETLAVALGTDAASLLMREPGSGDGIWTVWENATPAQRQQIVEIAQTITRKISNG